MAVSTCQKIAFISCSVLCMALFLPHVFLSRERKEQVKPEVGPGHFPPQHSFSEHHDHWASDSPHIKHYNAEIIARTRSGKPNLLGQVIPVYGFGIFLYIVYLFFKLTSKDKPQRKEFRFPVLEPEYSFREMPTFRLVELQARMSESVRENRLSKVAHPSARSRRSTRRLEEKRLRQLKEITQIMRERQLREGASPEEEAEETPYTADWEGYSEETYPQHDLHSHRLRCPSVILEEPDQVIPTAEELAERMEKEEEEEENEALASGRGRREQSVERNVEEEEEEKDEDDDEEENEEEEDDDEEDDPGEDQPCLPKDEDERSDETPQEGKRRRQITFSDHRHVYHYPKGGAVGCTYEEEEEEEEEEGDDVEEGNDEEDDEESEEEQKEEGPREEEEDPLMEAESLGFNDDAEFDPEEQEVNLIDFLQSYEPEVPVESNSSRPPEAGASATLRMRHKKQKVKK